MTKRQRISNFTHFTYQDEVCNPYRMAFVTLTNAQHAAATQSIQALESTRIGNRRHKGVFHATKESNAVKKRLIEEFSYLKLQAAFLIDVKSRCSDSESRSKCFEAYFKTLSKSYDPESRHKLILDRNDSRKKKDEFDLLQLKNQYHMNLHFQHVAGAKESLTILPDLVAWCFSHPGKAKNSQQSWRSQIKAAVELRVVVA